MRSFWRIASRIGCCIRRRLRRGAGRRNGQPSPRFSFFDVTELGFPLLSRRSWPLSDVTKLYFTHQARRNSHFRQGFLRDCNMKFPCGTPRFCSCKKKASSAPYPAHTMPLSKLTAKTKYSSEPVNLSFPVGAPCFTSVRVFRFLIKLFYFRLLDSASTVAHCNPLFFTVLTHIRHGVHG